MCMSVNKYIGAKNQVSLHQFKLPYHVHELYVYVCMYWCKQIFWGKESGIDLSFHIMRNYVHKYVCMHVYKLYMCVCLCIFTYVYTKPGGSMCINMYVCMHIDCMCVYIYIYIHTHTHTHIYIYIYVFLHTYIPSQEDPSRHVTTFTYACIRICCYVCMYTNILSFASYVMYVCVYVCMYVYAETYLTKFKIAIVICIIRNVCKYSHTFTCLYVCMYVCMYTHLTKFKITIVICIIRDV
jgi:hypothetical protein